MKLSLSVLLIFFRLNNGCAMPMISDNIYPGIRLPGDMPPIMKVTEESYNLLSWNKIKPESETELTSFEFFNQYFRSLDDPSQTCPAIFGKGIIVRPKQDRHSNKNTFPHDSLFLGQTPPGNKPKVFPLSVKQGCFAAERIAISGDGKDIYYSEIQGYYPIRGENIKRYSFTGGKWTGPFELFTGYAPALSVTGDTIFVERKRADRESDTYISVRKGSGWSDPVKILTQLDTAHYFQASRKGNYFVSSKSGNGAGLSDWCKVVIHAGDTIVSSLGRPLNTSGENLDFFVSADESYIIVTNRPRLAISYRKDDGSYSNPRYLGQNIDFGLGSWGPMVTPDNKYLFYTTGTKPDYSDCGIYWVRIDKLIDSLKKTNSAPYIKSLMKGLTINAGEKFSFTVPDTVFFDDESNGKLSFSAVLMTGNPLPDWMSFDPFTKTLCGLPPEPGEIAVKIIVKDPENATAFCPVKITILPKGKN